MKCFEEAAIVFAFASATRKAGPKHRERMRPVFLVHPCRHGFWSPTQSESHGFWSPTQSESYESCLMPPGNPQAIFNRKFVHTA
jgi:hypothetical protein